MISRCSKFIVYIALSTTLATCQIVKEGYVGVNFNAGGSYGGQVSGSGSGSAVKSYDKTYTVEGEGSHSAGAGASLEGSVVVPAPAVHSSIYFEKQIQPVQPVLVHKEVEYHAAPAPKPAPVVVDTVVTKEVAVPQDVYVRKVYRRPVHHRRKYVYVDTSAEVAPPPRVGFLTKLLAVGTAPAPAPAPAVVHHEAEVHKQVVVPQTTHYNTGTYTATASVNKNGQLFNDIFNIPISTLKAVNTLVNNIAGGVSVTKQVNTHAVHTVPADAHANAYVHAEGHVHA